MPPVVPFELRLDMSFKAASFPIRAALRLAQLAPLAVDAGRVTSGASGTAGLPDLGLVQALRRRAYRLEGLPALVAELLNCYPNTQPSAAQHGESFTPPLAVAGDPLVALDTQLAGAIARAAGLFHRPNTPWVLRVAEELAQDASLAATQPLLDRNDKLLVDEACTAENAAAAILRMIDERHAVNGRLTPDALRRHEWSAIPWPRYRTLPPAAAAVLKALVADVQHGMTWNETVVALAAVGLPGDQVAERIGLLIKPSLVALANGRVSASRAGQLAFRPPETTAALGVVLLVSDLFAASFLLSPAM